MKHDDEDLFDADGVMRRNGTFQVPLRFMDSAQRPMAERLQAILRDEVPVIDTNGQPAGHRPGYLLPTPGSAVADRVAVNQALQVTRRAMLGDASAVAIEGGRDEYVRRLGDAWRAA